MLIDWFTVTAQVLNFVILAWLMKRFLYGPVLAAIDDRERGLALQLSEAASAKAGAERERDELAKRTGEFDAQQAGLRGKAADEAKDLRQQLLDEARRETAGQRARWESALVAERRELSQDLTRRTAEEVFAIARKVLADLAAISLEEAMTGMFLRRLHSMSGAERDQLKAAFAQQPAAGVVRSAFELPAPQRTAIERATREALAIEFQLRFETVPELVNGIELAANGWKASWNVADYLASMEKTVAELLASRPGATAPAEPVPDSGAS